MLEHDIGPALVIDQRRDAMRLDHYLVEHGAKLDLPARLEMIRQLAEAVRYAHDRRLVHRALSPRAIVVEPGERGWTQPRLRIGEWQAAARGLSAKDTTHRVAPTTHAYQHVEAAAAAYLAPEFAAEADGTVAIDVFGLGATAYLILTGKAPAAGRPELMERLAAEGGLHPSAVSDAIPPDVDAVVELATAPRVSDRFADVDEFLAELDTRCSDRSGRRTRRNWTRGMRSPVPNCPTGRPCCGCSVPEPRRAHSSCSATASSPCSRWEV